MSSLGTTTAKIRFFQPHPALAPYISTLYLTEIASPEEKPVSDYLHPEWANLRLVSGGPLHAGIGAETPSVMPSFIATGPTSHATYFETAYMRAWGVGILPLGWAKLMGARASDYSDRFVDGMTDPVFARFADLHGQIFDGSEPDMEREAEVISNHLLHMVARAEPDDRVVAQAHAAIANPDISTVAQLSASLNMSGRSLERLCCRAFGFPPKLLLRRQRFLRTLAQVMLDPSMRWIASLDDHYHDQAHFSRDFKRFMGMTPSRYKSLPHPILGAAVFGRMAITGAAMQVLHSADGKNGNGPA